MHMGPQPWPPVLLALLLALLAPAAPPAGLGLGVSCQLVNVTYPAEAGATRFRCSTACEVKQCADRGCRVHALDPWLDLGEEDVGNANGTLSLACSHQVCRPGCKEVQQQGCSRPSGDPKYRDSPLDAPLQLLPFRFADGRGMAARWVTEDAVQLWDAASGHLASFRSFFCLKVSHPGPSSSSSSKPAYVNGTTTATALSFLISGDTSVDDDSGVVAVTFDMAREVVDGNVQHRVWVRSEQSEVSSKAGGAGGGARARLNESVLGSPFLNRTFGVWVEYDGGEQVMNVSMLSMSDMAPAYFALACSNVRPYARRVMSYKLDLRSRVRNYSHVGFQFSTSPSNNSSSSLGSGSDDLNQIFYWHFQTLNLMGETDEYEQHHHSPSPSGGAEGLGKERRPKSRNQALVGSAVAGTVLLVVGGLVGGALLFLCLHRRRRRRRRSSSSSIKYPPSAAGAGNSKSRRWSGPSVAAFSTDQGAPRKFSYAELRQATDNFSADNLLGEGGFGEVFKGVLRDKCTRVAVKRIAGKSRQGEKQFLAEVTIIGRLRHRNLVPLRGWCHNKRGGELMLVYDYMPNSSLDHHVLRPSRYLSKPSQSASLSAERIRSGRPVLGWAARLHVIKGVAAALLYLHEEWEEVGLKSSVVHRDIKSSNILLDAEWNARLGDFGLALLVERDKTAETVSSIAGTRGYLAPEYAYTGKVSVQADTYSFGVFMLEVSTGRRPIDWFRPDNERFLVQWVCQLHESAHLRTAVDPELLQAESKAAQDPEEVLLVLRLGLLCTLNDPADRPSMRQVVHYLAVGDSASVLLPDSISAYQQEHLASRTVPSPDHRGALGSQASDQTTTTTTTAARSGGARTANSLK